LIKQTNVYIVSLRERVPAEKTRRQFKEESVKTLIVSYSHTGNNQALVEACAAELKADHFRLEEVKERKITTTLLDMAFGRMPRLKSLPPSPEAYGLVVFMAPIWMFNIASPLRLCFRAMKGTLKKYAFVSLSGGALGANVGLPRELGRRLGKKILALVLDLNAAHFCLPLAHEGAEIGTAATSEYRLADRPGDLARLSRIACCALAGIQA
jgi:hypothetical protein